MDPILAQALCGFPERLHPVSQMFLDTFIAGEMTRADFVRFFSLPNSDYLQLAYCFASMFTSGTPV